MLKLPCCMCIYYYQYVKLLLTPEDLRILLFKKTPAFSICFFNKIKRIFGSGSFV
jgi:hypothetical protein